MITVNGESRTLEKPVTVTEYLEACNYVPVQVVVELNEEIIKRETYDTTVLKDGDVVEILQFMGGGNFTYRKNKNGYRNSCSEV